MRFGKSVIGPLLLGMLLIGSCSNAEEATVDIAGVWIGTWTDSPHFGSLDNGRFLATATQNDSKAEGYIYSASSGQPMSGTLRGNHVTASRSLDQSDGGTVTYRFSGTFEDDDHGTGTFQVEPKGYSGEWQAVKVPEKRVDAALPITLQVPPVRSEDRVSKYILSAFTVDRRIWVFDEFNNRLFAFLPTGEFIGSARLESVRPISIAAEGDSLWLLEGGGRIARITVDETVGADETLTITLVEELDTLVDISGVEGLIYAEPYLWARTDTRDPELIKMTVDGTIELTEKFDLPWPMAFTADATRFFISGHPSVHYLFEVDASGRTRFAYPLPESDTTRILHAAFYDGLLWYVETDSSDPDWIIRRVRLP